MKNWRGFLEELDNVNWTVLRDQLLDPGIIVHFPGNPKPLNLDEYEATDRMIYAAFPNGRHIVEELIAEGDLVVCRTTVQGTHKGEPFQGVAPSGKTFTVGSTLIGRVAGGKLVEIWAESDMLSFMQQIGAIPDGVKPILS